MAAVYAMGFESSPTLGNGTGSDVARRSGGWGASTPGNGRRFGVDPGAPRRGVHGGQADDRRRPTTGGHYVVHTCCFGIRGPFRSNFFSCNVSS